MTDAYQYPMPPAPAIKKTRRWPWVVGIIAALFVGIGIGGAGESSPPAATSYTPPAPAAPAYEPSSAPTVALAPPAPTGPATTFSDGVYEVGADIEAGRYKTTGPDGSGFIDSCYWERAKDDSSEFSAIISNDNIGGPGSITVKAGEFVKASGGCVWAKL